MVNKRFMTLDLLEDAIKYGDGKRCSKSIFSNEDERKRAKDNWDKLERYLQLEDKYYHAINALKVIRNTKAHPLKIIINVQRILEKQDGVNEHVFLFLEKLKLMEVEDIHT